MTLNKSQASTTLKDDVTGDKANIGTKADGSTKGVHTITEVETTSEAPIIVQFPKKNRSAFGDQISESMEPVTQISATYGLNGDTETFSATGGSVDTFENQFRVQSGTSLGGYGVIRTRRPTVYREGQGLMGRFTASFTSPVALSLQFAGFFTLTETIAFGYRGTDFGIIFDTYGNPEIRKLSITNVGSGTLTLTLDGTAYNIPITNVSAAHNAHEIEEYMEGNQSIWSVQHEGSEVYFQARDTSSRNGTYSTSGGGTFAGTITQERAGNAKVEKTILQANFNKNTCSWLSDKTKLNIFMIKISYLGVGPIQFFAMNPNTQEFVLVHEETFANTATKPSLSKRSLKLGWTAASLGSTGTNLTVKGGSAGSFIEGESRVFGAANSISATNSAVGSTYEGILTIRTKLVFGGNVMLGRIVPIGVYVSNDGSKRAEFTIIKNPTWAARHFVDYNSDSIAQYATDQGAFTGSEPVSFTGVIAAGGASYISLKDLDLELELDDELTIFGRKVSGTDVEMTATFVWKEDF